MKPFHLAVFTLLVITILALLAPVIAPDSTPQANDQQPLLARQQLGSSTWMLEIPKNEPSDIGLFHFLMEGEPSRFTARPLVSFKESVDSIQLEFLKGPLELKSKSSLPAGWRITQKTFPLGSDSLGRCLWSRLLWGARISLSVGLVAVLVSLLIGLSLGLLAGYKGGWADQLIMFVASVAWSVPTLLLIVALAMLLGKGLGIIFVAIGLTMWVEVARLIRGQVLSIKQMQYIDAARVLGFSDARIMFRHILPNVAGPLLVVSASNFANAILIEAGLSFLGLGVPPPTPSWGNLLAENRGFITTDLAYLELLPAFSIMLLVLIFNVIGNHLRDRLSNTTS